MGWLTVFDPKCRQKCFENANDIVNCLEKCVGSRKTFSVTVKHIDVIDLPMVLSSNGRCIIIVDYAGSNGNCLTFRGIVLPKGYLVEITLCPQNARDFAEIIEGLP